jgi:hypothetical protein
MSFFSLHVMDLLIGVDRICYAGDRKLALKMRENGVFDDSMRDCCKYRELINCFTKTKFSHLHLVTCCDGSDEGNDLEQDDSSVKFLSLNER